MWGQKAAGSSLRLKLAEGFRAGVAIAGTSRCQLLPPPPAPVPPPWRLVCGAARSGCSALLAPAGLFDVVSAPVAAPAPVLVRGATVVEPVPEVAVFGEAPGDDD